MLGISLKETSIERRGFRVSEAAVQRHLEKIGEMFLEGYHAALQDDGPEALANLLSGVAVEFRGFAFEGAAMALTLLDHLTPWNSGRLRSFLESFGAPHVYMVHVGTGWAFARLPWLGHRVENSLSRLDTLLRWLAVDGYGFHEGYFHWRSYIKGQPIPSYIRGYARQVFDQGLGRSLWFVEGADAVRIPATIAVFPPSRRANLWGGVGLACAYAGGVDGIAIQRLVAAAGPYLPQLAQGAAFAAKAREQAGNPAEHTELACRILCGLSADAAAKITDLALENLPFDQEEPAYEIWRQRIQAQFTREVAVA